MPVPGTPSQASVDQPKSALRPEIAAIIEDGRTAEPEPDSGSLWSVTATAALSAVLLWVSFTPCDFAPVAWIAILPLCLLLRVTTVPRRTYRLLAVIGFLCAVATLQWMRLGHIAMYGGLAALSLYVGLYLPAFVAIGRSLMRSGLPMWLVAPVAWTSLEYLRAYLLTGFSWYYLGHTQYQWTSLVQISDLTGAYGVSFVVALSSGVLVTLVSPGVFVRLKLVKSADDVLSASVTSQRVGAASLLMVVILSCVYGHFRMPPPDDTKEGPVVAVIQGNFTPEVKHDPTQWLQMVRVHDLLTRRAAGLRPDLIVWPETMFPVPDRVIVGDVSDEQLAASLPPELALNSEQVAAEVQHWHDKYARRLLTNRSQEAGAAMLVGLLTEQASPEGRQRYNSAAFIKPTSGYDGRYDKIHRVIFGEYIPLRSVLPWLTKVTPFGAGFGIDAGQQPVTFADSGYRYSPIICFEDTVPHLVRRVVAGTSSGERPDVLVNMTNDAWFRGSSELDQHLITATFRSIETRRPLVRAVNGGISAFIDSAGRIRQPEHFLVMKEETAGVAAEFQKADGLTNPETGKRYRQCSAVMCGQIPLDGRDTLYLQWGDWFPMLCSLITIMGLLTVKFRSPPNPSDDGESARSPETKIEHQAA